MLITSQLFLPTNREMESGKATTPQIRKNVARKSTSNRPLKAPHKSIYDDIHNADILHSQRLEQLTKACLSSSGYSGSTGNCSISVNSTSPKQSFDLCKLPDNSKKCYFNKKLVTSKVINHQFSQEESDEEIEDTDGVFCVSDALLPFFIESNTSPQYNSDSSDETLDISRVLNYPKFPDDILYLNQESKQYSSPEVLDIDKVKCNLNNKLSKSKAKKKANCKNVANSKKKVPLKKQTNSPSINLCSKDKERGPLKCIELDVPEEEKSVIFPSPVYISDKDDDSNHFENEESSDPNIPKIICAVSITSEQEFEEYSYSFPEEIVHKESDSVLKEKEDDLVNEESDSVLKQKEDDLVNEESDSVLKRKEDALVNVESDSVLQKQKLHQVKEESDYVLKQKKVQQVNEESGYVLQQVNEESGYVLQQVNEESGYVLQQQKVNVKEDSNHVLQHNKVQQGEKGCVVVSEECGQVVLGKPVSRQKRKSSNTLVACPSVKKKTRSSADLNVSINDDPKSEDTPSRQTFGTNVVDDLPCINVADTSTNSQNSKKVTTIHLKQEPKDDHEIEHEVRPNYSKCIVKLEPVEIAQQIHNEEQLKYRNLEKEIADIDPNIEFNKLDTSTNDLCAINEGNIDNEDKLSCENKTSGNCEKKISGIAEKSRKKEINEGVLLHIEAVKKTDIMQDGKILKDKEELIKDIESKIEKNLPVEVKDFDIQQSLTEEILLDQALRLAHQRVSPRRRPLLTESEKKAVLNLLAGENPSKNLPKTKKIPERRSSRGKANKEQNSKNDLDLSDSQVSDSSPGKDKDLKSSETIKPVENNENAVKQQNKRPRKKDGKFTKINNSKSASKRQSSAEGLELLRSDSDSQDKPSSEAENKNSEADDIKNSEADNNKNSETDDSKNSQMHKNVKGKTNRSNAAKNKSKKNRKSSVDVEQENHLDNSNSSEPSDKKNVSDKQSTDLEDTSCNSVGEQDENENKRIPVLIIKNKRAAFTNKRVTRRQAQSLFSIIKKSELQENNKTTNAENIDVQKETIPSDNESSESPETNTNVEVAPRSPIKTRSAKKNAKKSADTTDDNSGNNKSKDEPSASGEHLNSPDQVKDSVNETEITTVENEVKNSTSEVTSSSSNENEVKNSTSEVTSSNSNENEESIAKPPYSEDIIELMDMDVDCDDSGPLSTEPGTQSIPFLDGNEPSDNTSNKPTCSDESLMAIIKNSEDKSISFLTSDSGPIISTEQAATSTVQSTEGTSLSVTSSESSVNNISAVSALGNPLMPLSPHSTLANVNSSNNQYVGSAALANVNSSNQYVGSAALANVNSSNNQHVGSAALANVNSSNQYVGSAALANVNSSNNQYVGSAALANVNSSNNQYVGSAALGNVNSSNNQHVGSAALANVNSSNNQFVGSAALANVNSSITQTSTMQNNMPYANFSGYSPYSSALPNTPGIDPAQLSSLINSSALSTLYQTSYQIHMSANSVTSLTMSNFNGTHIQNAIQSPTHLPAYPSQFSTAYTQPLVTSSMSGSGQLAAASSLPAPIQNSAVTTSTYCQVAGDKSSIPTPNSAPQDKSASTQAMPNSEAKTQHNDANTSVGKSTPTVIPLSILARDPRLRNRTFHVITGSCHFEVATSVGKRDVAGNVEPQNNCDKINTRLENINYSSEEKTNEISEHRETSNSITDINNEDDHSADSDLTDFSKKKSKKKEVDEELIYKTPLSDLHDAPERTSYSRIVPRRPRFDSRRDPRSSRKRDTSHERSPEHEHYRDREHDHYREREPRREFQEHQNDDNSHESRLRSEGYREEYDHRRDDMKGVTRRSDYYSKRRSDDVSLEDKRSRDYSERRPLLEHSPDYRRSNYRQRDNYSDTRDYRRPNYSEHHRENEEDSAYWDYAHKRLDGVFPADASGSGKVSKSDIRPGWDDENEVRDLVEGPMSSSSTPFFRRRRSSTPWNSSHLRDDEGTLFERRREYEARHVADGTKDWRSWGRDVDEDLNGAPNRRDEKRPSRGMDRSSRRDYEMYEKKRSRRDWSRSRGRNSPSTSERRHMESPMSPEPENVAYAHPPKYLPIPQ